VIAAVILAAGASQRMGQPKALLRIGGDTLLGRVVHTAQRAGAQALVVATGPPHGSSIQQELAGLAVKWAWNDQPEQGMLSSVQAALPAVPEAAVGALIWPVDVPFVAVSTVKALLAADLDQLAVLSCQGRGGHPLWLPRRLFREALALSPQLGLRALRTRHPLLRVEVADPQILRDLDTPEDLAQARARWESY